MEDKKTGCECPLAGYCNRHGIKKNHHYHKLCQNHTGYFNMWEECRGPGQNFIDCDQKQVKTEEEVKQSQIIEVKKCVFCNNNGCSGECRNTRRAGFITAGWRWNSGGIWLRIRPGRYENSNFGSRSPRGGRSSICDYTVSQIYQLPCRTGGMLTNAHCPDAQAASEATLLMSTAVRNGANFIVHACGQLGFYISMSFEKWLIDEEVCHMLRRVLTAMDITDKSIDLDTIKSVGSDGNYLAHPSTFKHCRNLYRPNLFTRDDYQSWWKNGAKNALEVAAEVLPKRLEEYTKPPIDDGLEQALLEFVGRRKKQYFESPSNAGYVN